MATHLVKWDEQYREKGLVVIEIDDGRQDEDPEEVRAHAEKLGITFPVLWDKDGVTDWDELAPGLPACSDPFQTKNCENVGGVAELADVATTPLEAADSSSNIGLIAAIAAAAVIGVAAVGGVAMFARRRQE